MPIARLSEKRKGLGKTRLERFFALPEVCEGLDQFEYAFLPHHPSQKQHSGLRRFLGSGANGVAVYIEPVLHHMQLVCIVAVICVETAPGFTLADDYIAVSENPARKGSAPGAVLQVCLDEPGNRRKNHTRIERQ